eukprot:s279_g8.t1
MWKAQHELAAKMRADVEKDFEAFKEECLGRKLREKQEEHETALVGEAVGCAFRTSSCPMANTSTNSTAVVPSEQEPEKRPAAWMSACRTLFVGLRFMP